MLDGVTTITRPVPKPRRCDRDVDRLLGEGAEGTVTEAITGPNGGAVLRQVEWPNPGEGRGVNLFQSYIVSNGLVVRDTAARDRRSAIVAIA